MQMRTRIKVSGLQSSSADFKTQVLQFLQFPQQRKAKSSISTEVLILLYVILISGILVFQANFGGNEPETPKVSDSSFSS